MHTPYSRYDQSAVFPSFLDFPAVFPSDSLTGSKSAWWEGCRTGRYSKPVKLGPRTTVWRVEDIKAFIESVGKDGSHE